MRPYSKLRYNWDAPGALAEFTGREKERDDVLGALDVMWQWAYVTATPIFRSRQGSGGMFSIAID